MSWKDAIQQGPDGTRLLVEVSPGAKEEAFPDGYNPWRGRIGVRVRAPAEDGKANDAVLRLVADRLGLPSGTVVLAGGSTDTRKLLQVVGMKAADVAAALAPSFEEA